MLLKFQDAPYLIPASIILEMQVSGAFYFLLGREMRNVADAILAADVRDGHRVYFVIRQKYGILQTFCYLTECLCISGECIEVATRVGEYGFSQADITE